MTMMRDTTMLDPSRFPQTAAENIQYGRGEMRDYANIGPVILRAYWEKENTPPELAVFVCFVHVCERCQHEGKEAFPYPAGWLCNDCYEEVAAV